MSPLNLYALFHLNMAYSSIEEEQRPAVIDFCYWPLLRLCRRHKLPLAIEASAYTLETIASIDPAWLSEFRCLLRGGNCEFVGSGYTQIIGPLVPAIVNSANLRIGHEVYGKVLGFRPQVALINEQAYSAGIVKHFIEAGYRAIVMEWDNPARYHADWNPEWRYLPQFACGPKTEKIPLIWNHSIAFQKFQRYAHGDIEIEEYLAYLNDHIGVHPRAFPIYGNDAEIFDYRPGRYHTEAPLKQRVEWQRISALFDTLLADTRYEFIRPSQVLELLEQPAAGHSLHLESPEQPIPVKKQGKYNVTRWAVTGRNDLAINTVCWRIYEALLARPEATTDQWRELCYLWSSDFRTHITKKRWQAYRERLRGFSETVGATDPSIPLQKLRQFSPGPNSKYGKVFKIERNGRYLTLDSEQMRVRLNCQRGLAVDALWLKKVSDLPLVGTLHHGYFNDIAWSADYYTGHLIYEAPGQPKMTDLIPVEPVQTQDPHNLHLVKLHALILTGLGPVWKTVQFDLSEPSLSIKYSLDWPDPRIGSLRIGHITLIPSAFDFESLSYCTQNGGYEPESFLLGNNDVEHGRPISFLVSSSHGIGLTERSVVLGDQFRRVCVTVDKTLSSLLGLVSYRRMQDTFFLRVSLSAQEMDDTSKGYTQTHSSFAFKISQAV